MKILVACEYSGRVRDAFTARGHDATSCDTLPTESPGPHYQGDVRDVLDDGWDLMIAFPPCTHLASAGARWWPQKRADGRQKAAADFFLSLYHADVPRIVVENPSGIMSTSWRKPDQIIQPWWFGDPYTKSTCLWLKNVPKLEPTNLVKSVGQWVSSGNSSINLREGRAEFGGHRDPKMRSLTFKGIAEAMADQWSGLDNDPGTC